MKTIKFTIGALSVLAGATFYSCQPEEFKLGQAVLELPAVPFNYFVGDNDNLPTLGRVLFYDPRLSVNNSVSCSSCHKQTMAFADGKNFSPGFENKLTGRNSMPIQNIVADIFSGFEPGKPGGGILPGEFPGFPSIQPTALFWDGRQRSLKTMVMEPIKNHIEMGTSNLDLLAVKLSETADYKPLFSATFNESSITPERIAKALSAFLVSIRSNQSKFDQSLNGTSTLTGLELLGKSLFFEKYDCNSCHQLQAPFNGYQLAGEGEFGGFADIGLDKVPADEGAFRVSGNDVDKGKFKIPSLRNVALTSPYMHDGRFESLEEVMDHYSEGISDSENLDARLQEGGAAKKFNIPLADKKAIIAFLHSMTDYQMISDPKFSNPFKFN